MTIFSILVSEFILEVTTIPNEQQGPRDLFGDLKKTKKVNGLF